MKNLLVKASILAILCSMIGCADRDDEASSSDCDVNVCKDANTMTFCNEGTPMDVPCTLGCDEAKGECKTAEPACVADVCNGNDLIQCINGVQTPVTCPNGCENGACRPATGGSCTINICKDANVLLACVSGVQQETDCPFGCEAGACKEKCTGNYCKDAGTLVSCDENGVSTVKTCANGCDAGACLDACESNFCRDASNLMVCTDGKLSIVNCPYGCDAGACKTSVVTDCTNGDKKCLDDSMLQVCMNGQWVNGRTCDNGCVNNDCVGQDDECENGAKECADNAARTCVAGVWVVSQCTNGCEDGVCVAPPVTECTDGSKKCDGKNVMNCVDGKWVAGDACDDICLNGACASTADLPKVGDKCDDSFVELCAENAGYYCYEGEVANFECDSDAPCAVRASDNYSDCAVACNAGDAAQNVCMTYMGYPLAVTYTCDKTEDGGYGFFMGDYEFCESSCNNGVCDGQTPTTCTEGAKQCSGKNVQTCTNGAWVTSNTCEIGCKNGACTSDPVVTPTVGDKCDDNFVELCDGNTGYYCHEGEVASLECDNDAPCAVRAADNYSDCAVACNAGDAAQNVCMSYMGYPLAVTYTCDKTEAGGYALFMGDYQFCESSCNNGVCDGQTPTTCTEGAKQCSGKNVQTCTNGAWVTSNTCEIGCKNGACTSDPVVTPTVGDKCDDNFVELCDGNTGYYCYEGEVASIECDNDAPCAVRAADNYSDCAETCKAGDAAQNVCMSYMGYPLAVTYTCDKTEAGGYALFMGDYEFCESSCSDGVCDGQTPTTCTEGAKQCSGKDVQTCTNGAWVTSNTCEIGCKNGACTSDPVVTPTVGDKCDDNFVELCDGNTGYYCYEGEVASIECDNDAPCAVRAADNYSDCAETCKAGDAAQNVCMSYMGYPLAVTYTCDKTEAGGYALFMGDYEFCESSCSDGVCDGQTPTTCTEGAKQCSGKNVQTCTNGKWVTSNTCEVGCQNGACTSNPSTPTVGDKCDDSFVELCDGNTGYYCNEGKVASIECDNSAPCAVRAADNYSDCAETCKAGDAAQNSCISYMGYPLAVTYTCDKTEAGGYAFFMADYEFCESSCSNGVCK